MVNVSVEVLGVPLVRMVCGLNDLAMTGGLNATRLAEAKPVAVVFSPVIGEEMKPLTLGCGPAVVATTSTCAVQVPSATPLPRGTVAPVGLPKVKTVAPAV